MRRSKVPRSMTRRFDIHPLKGPLPIRFGMSESDIEAVLGPPLGKSKNRRGEPDWDYGEFAIRFAKDGTGVDEVSFLPAAYVMFDRLDLFNDAGAFNDVIKRSKEVYECVGFIVLPELGVTFTGFHDNNESDKAISVFRKGRWDHLRSECRPFSLP
jgi:hypothetical protein